ncbi:transposase family protein, partial [Tritonibacter sp. SIMBA_163]|uniref:transposase family protein n=1 Tax=Tritonibacter sp. SIMBA_163 TaxID=3080868 RepID=UPI0039808BAA
DIKLFQEHKSIFSVEQTFSGDKAYVGDNQITTPEKKPKNGELNSSQKEENKKLSSQRIFVEHMIRLVKVFQVGRDHFRLQISRYK